MTPRNSYFSRRAARARLGPEGMDSVEFQVRNTLQPALEPPVSGQGFRLWLSLGDSQDRACSHGRFCISGTIVAPKATVGRPELLCLYPPRLACVPLRGMRVWVTPDRCESCLRKRLLRVGELRGCCAPRQPRPQDGAACPVGAGLPHGCPSG